jgi:Right handed beta helix region
MNLLTAVSVWAFALSLLFIPSHQNGGAPKGSGALQARDSLKGSVRNLREFGKAGLGGDDTPVFRRALAEASRQGQALQISAARGTYRISPLYLPSKITLLLDSGVTIQGLPGFVDGQRLLNIVDVSAVQIIGYGAFLKMNRAEYKSGEYRDCLSIKGSSLIAVKGVTCLTPGGAGVYVGASDNKPFSEDVTIEDVRVENSLRAGLEVISARNLAVRRSHFVDSHGSEKSGPHRSVVEKASGILMMPGGAGARLDNIRLEENATSHSEGDGLRVVLSRLTASSPPVSVAVVGHHDSGAGGSSYLGMDDPASGRAVRGHLLFEDCLSESAQEYGAVFSFWNSAGARVTFRGLTVIDPDGSGSTMDNAAVAVKRGGGGHEPIGNVEFIRTTIRDTRQPPKLDYYFSFADYSYVGMQNVIFSDPVQLTGARHKQPLGLYQGQGVGVIQRADERELRALWLTAEKTASTKR